MNRSRWVIATLAILVAQCAFADSIAFKINQATISVLPNTGGGDNVSFTLNGPHASILGFGGIACFAWCDPLNNVFAPGSSPPLNIDQIFLTGFGNVTLGGHSFDPDSLNFNSAVSAVILGSFTFPKHFSGSSFSACVPAAMPGPLSGFVGSGSDFTTFVLQMPSGGRFCSKWSFVPKSGDFAGGFVFSSGRFVAATVPESGTLSLLGLGLAGIGVVLRQRVLRGRTRASRAGCTIARR
jgi:hypothetical protein